MRIEAPNQAQFADQGRALVRMSARLRSRRLDEALARGIPSGTTAPIALRARRLAGMSRRRAIAAGLRQVIRDSGRTLPPSHARISPCRAQVMAAIDELACLADALSSPGPVAIRGVAQAWILVTDGTGPLYSPKSTANLRARAASAASHLRLED